MEKMNQVSVTEFMPKSKEEMYDMAVEMVNKYNRLVDICNDSAERIADLIERHKVYTSALNKDIADKAAKIELLEKEIEGRKECYTALKELMDTKYISIDYHNDVCKAYEKKVVELKKESEKWQDLAKMNRDTICNQYDVCEDFKKKIAEIEEENEKLKVDLIHEREKNEKLAKAHAELENDIRKYTTEIKTLEEKVKHQRENLDGINKTLEIRTKENERLIAVRNNKEREIEAHESENARLTEKIMELKKERDRHMARVNDLRMELDCVKASKEKHEEAVRDKLVEGLRENITYWRNKYIAAQDEIEKLNGTIEELKKEKDSEIEKLKNSVDSWVNEYNFIKSQREIDYVHVTKYNQLWKGMEKLKVDLIHEREKNEKLALKNKEDDHGKSGFEEYIKYIINKEEGKFKEELNKRFSEEVSKISMQRTEEELTKVKLNEKYGYAGEIAFRIRSEVDKKRIVDISEGAEKILGVSRELFDAAIKALVDDGYQEIIGRIPQATNSYVYMDMHVLATPDVETRETANAENIKSLDSGIPCGEDSIE